ncbi:hypothetical protein KQI65_10935 [bacterium]|nr:hypothetical protein [bacterium]
MKFSKFLLPLLLVLLLGNTCTDSTTEPPPAKVEGPSSQDWTWEHTIIDPENTKGHLWDVCYINDTCVWAVGWIQHKGENYNACRWDGKEWKLEKVWEDPMGSATEPSVHELHTIFGTSPDDIWFLQGTVFIHWDGHEYETDSRLLSVLRDAGGMRTCWGTGPRNIYAAGMKGQMIHYNGNYWNLLKSDIDQDITAMHGNGDTVLVAATGPGDAGPTAFYTVVGEKVEFFSQDSLPHGVQALWFSHLDDIYTDGPHAFHFDGKSWQKTMDWELEHKSGYGRDMAANSRWDILVVGAASTILHYNQETWKSFQNLPGLETAYFKGCTMHGDEAWVVGVLTEGTEVVIVKGMR